MADRVQRTNTGHLVVDGKWYWLQDVADAAYKKLKAAGSSNPAFDMPPLFFTGSPYGDAVHRLGCTEVRPPKTYRVEYVPHGGRKPWRAISPIWPEVFGLDAKAYES